MITVRELKEKFPLDLVEVAGADGDERPITWAHAVDLPDPWRWINPGNLVMTTGVGLPRKASEQIAWIEKLALSHASALVFARHARAPDLAPAMLEIANRLGFPILQASFELEFIRLSRFVIESVLAAERRKLRASERLFQVYAEALRARHDMAGRLQVLEQHLGVQLSIEDAASQATLFASADTTRAQDPKQLLERIAIGGRSRANLLVRHPGHAASPDALVIQSLVGLLGVELERVMLERDAQRQEGEALLKALLEDDTDLSVVRPLLERRGLHGTLVSAAIRPGSAGAWSVDSLHHAPGIPAGIPWHLEDGLLLALLPEEDLLLEALRAVLGRGTVLGVSGPVTAATGFRESLRQARFSLAHAREAGLDAARYGEFETGLILAPKSLAESRALVGRYLGPLIEHDRVNDAALLKTLITFLSNDANWKTTAFDLDIHRQTLVYRLKLVERLTGFKPTTTDGGSRLWFAIQAGRNADLFPPGS